MTTHCLRAVRLACLAAAFVVGSTAFGNRAVAQEAAPTERDDDFDLAKEAKGKIVYLTLMHADEAVGDNYTVFLAKARTVRFGGKLLIVGTGYAAEKEDDAWYKDMTIGVAWDSVMAFHIMTEKQYDQFMAAPPEEDQQASLPEPLTYQKK